jgi:hypothetical protein
MVLKSDDLQFVNIFSAIKFAISCSVDLLYHVCQTVLLKILSTENIQVTEGRK